MNSMFRIPLLYANKKCLANSLRTRTFKNFGHKRRPIPRFTQWWHGFLTFSFIGLGIEWKRISRFIFGEDLEEPTSPLE